MTGSVRIVPSEKSAHIERQARKAERSKLSGWSRAYARKNQMLPYAGTCLTNGEIENLRRHLQTIAEAPRSNEVPQEVALLSSILTTGRNISALKGLPVRVWTGNIPEEPCLTLGTDWLWWLPPGAPSSEQEFPEGVIPRQASRPALISIPCSVRTRSLLLRMTEAPEPGKRLFRTSHQELRDAVRRQARSAGVAGSVRMIEGWLFQRLVEIRNGDLAVAAILTGQVPPIAKTVIHYSSISASSIASFLRCAVEPLETLQMTLPPAQEARLGSRYAPSIAEVAALIEEVRRPLSIPRTRRGTKPAIAIHNAVTLYTVLFYLIASCARPVDDLLPDFEAIDPLTGFLIIDDKPTRDNYKTRLIWISKECREQLKLYRSHLEKVRRRIPSLTSFDDGGLPFLLDQSGKPKCLDRRGLRAALKAVGWTYPANFARHLARSELIGRISSEAIHAMFGHWHLGTEPWSLYSALDPLAYRAELEKAVPSLCEQCGLTPRGGL